MTPLLPARTAAGAWRLIALLPLLLAGCDFNPSGLELKRGWEAKSLAVWRHLRPDMMVLSSDRRLLYISCENPSGLETPSLFLYNLADGHSAPLISGLDRADGLKRAPDGSLWLGEEADRGLIWRIAQPDLLPSEQIVERKLQRSSHPAITPLRGAGTFAHEGIAFSADGRFAYLPDEHPGGALYRYRMRPPHRLELLADDGRWRVVSDPSQARIIAPRLGALRYQRMEDVERLPDGRLLIAETDAARILALTDHGERAEIRSYLSDPRLRHPDNLAWDQRRGWLWITDDSHPSLLWAWDGEKLIEIARHRHASITGVLPLGDDILINLQGRKDGPELTIRLSEMAGE